MSEHIPVYANIHQQYIAHGHGRVVMVPGVTTVTLLAPHIERVDDDEVYYYTLTSSRADGHIDRITLGQKNGAQTLVMSFGYDPQDPGLKDLIILNTEDHDLLNRDFDIITHQTLEIAKSGHHYILYTNETHHVVSEVMSESLAKHFQYLWNCETPPDYILEGRTHP